MSLPKSSHTPDDPKDLPPARRRRAKRGLIPDDFKSEAAEAEKLAHQTSPSFDFFLFTLLSGTIIGVGIMLDSPALLVLGALAAPVLAPFIGISLGTAAGSIQFFTQRLISALVASALVFGVGTLSGFVAQVYSITQLNYASAYSQIHWTHILLLSVGTVFTILGILHKKHSPNLPSAALAYELYLPLTAAGFGLGSGIKHLWPDGLVVFSTHLVILSLLGTIIFIGKGIRPLTFIGYTIGSLVIILGILILIGISSAGLIFTADIALPTPTPTLTQTPTPLPPTATQTLTPIPPSPTLTATVPTATNTPLPSPTTSPTLKPTPFFGEVSVSEEYAGAFIRAEPNLNSQRLTGLINGTLVEILDPAPVLDEQGRSWLNIRYEDAEGEGEGWILENLILIPTPVPNW